MVSDPLDALALAHERGRRLRAEAAVERDRDRSRTRRALAASLRRAADRLDRVPAVRRVGEPVVSGRRGCGEIG